MKPRGARERLREANGKCEGRKSGAPYSASCVKSMVEGAAPAA
jgi:hypothetical protein